MATNQLLKQQVLQANRGKIKIKKPKKWLYPMQAERIYIKQLLEINKVFWDNVNSTIVPALPMLVAQAKSTRPDSEENRLDADYAKQLKELTDKTYLDFSKAVNQPRITTVSAEQAQRIALLNKKEFVKVIHSSLSVNPIVQETWLQPQMQSFTAQNVDLITNLGLEQKKRVEQNLFQNLSAGHGIDKIKEDLQKSENFGKYRSKLIARDQTNKFNGQLTQLRQSEVGIGQYVWSTARDERVRPTHAAMEGTIVDWNKPPPIGHPGSEINCRCIAQPIITDDMFDNEDFLPTPLALPAPDNNEEPVAPIQKAAVPIGKSTPSATADLDKFNVKSYNSAVGYSSELNFQDKAALKEYKNSFLNSNIGGYTAIQNYLRTGNLYEDAFATKEMVKEYVDSIDKAMKKGKLKMASESFRGIRENSGQKYVAMNVGDTFADKGYFSTSTQRFVAENFTSIGGANGDKLPVVFKVTGKPGTNVVFIPDVDPSGIETELLFGRDQKFQIMKKTKLKDHWEIEIESVVGELAKKLPEASIVETKAVSKLTNAEIDAIKEYQNGVYNSKVGGYTNIQSYLRNNKPAWDGMSLEGVKEVVADIDKAIAKSKLAEDATLYRGIKHGQKYIDLNIGQTFSDKGYFSTTKNKSVADKFADKLNRDERPVVFKIEAKQGDTALKMNDFSKSKENEVLFPRDQKFEIINKVDKGKYWSIEIKPVK